MSNETDNDWKESKTLRNIIIVVVAFFICLLLYFISGGVTVPIIAIFVAIIAYGLYKFITAPGGYSFWTGYWLIQGAGPLLELLWAGLQLLGPLIEALFKALG